MAPPVRPSGVLSLKASAITDYSLVWCVAPGPDNTAELVSGGAGTLLASGSWAGSTAMGPALDSSSTSTGGAYWPWSATFLNIVQACSIVFFGRIDALVTNSKALCLPTNDASVSNNALALGMQATGTPGELWYRGSANRLVASDNAMVAVGSGTLGMYGVTRSGTAVLFYRDGAQHGVAKTISSQNTVFTADVPICLLNRSSTSPTLGVDGACSLALVSSRVLTLGEMAALWADPWTVLFDAGTPSKAYFFARHILSRRTA